MKLTEANTNKLDKKWQYDKVQCNKELAENTRLRNLIDMERRRSVQAKFISNDLEGDCNKIETEADKHSFKTKKNISEMENIHKTMTFEQCRHEEDQAFFTSELNNLENELTSDKKAKDQQIKDFKELLNNLMTTGNAENLNSTPIINCLKKKYEKKVYDLKKNIESYKANIHEIENAFKTIKEASNLTD